MDGWVFDIQPGGTLENVTSTRSDSSMASRKPKAGPVDYEANYDDDGFATEAAYSFPLRRETFTCKVFTMEARDRELNDLTGDEVDFFETVLDPESLKRFLVHANDKTNPIRPETIQKLVPEIVAAIRGGGPDPDPKSGD